MSCGAAVANFLFCNHPFYLASREIKKNDPQVSILSLSHQQKQKNNFSKLNPIFQFCIFSFSQWKTELISIKRPKTDSLSPHTRAPVFHQDLLNMLAKSESESKEEQTSKKKKKMDEGEFKLMFWCRLTVFSFMASPLNNNKHPIVPCLPACCQNHI